MSERVHLGSAYRSLWTATAASAIGTGMTVTALPLVARASGLSEWKLGVISAAGLLPGLLFALPTGMLADRYDRARLLVISDVGRALVLLIATILVLGDRANAWVLAGIAFLVGVGETLYVGSAQALVPLVVEDDALDTANGRLQATEDTCREFVGPPLGSFLHSVASWLPFGLDTVSYVASSILLVRMPSPPHVPPSERPSLSPAWAALRQSRPLTVLAVALLALSFTGAAVLAILIVIVEDELGVARAWYGPFVATLAVGGAAAGLVAGRLRMVMSAKTSLVMAVSLNAWSYAVLGLTDSWPIALGALLIWGFSVTFGMVTALGIRQRLTPADLLGRVMGIFRTLVGAGAVSGALVGGALAAGTSASTVATIAGMAQLPIVALIVFALPRDV